LPVKNHSSLLGPFIKLRKLSVIIFCLKNVAKKLALDNSSAERLASLKTQAYWAHS
jgi:hypothetical protein